MEGSSQTPVLSDVTPGEALSVKRFFTTRGQHAFDTLEWEHRDARIAHGDRVAFEQPDVEFPKSWSQNATNIVAQKYFRGQLGSPTREHSVKQMIGRVAGTIADWGRSRGYFASVEDGDAFQSELIYVLVHQMAAFNSPVWFNVGFEESPQSSACFILSVQDTMDSILDWNTKEGKIFLGGSGSGVNLSNIRGSMEPLSKGGTASGPVSFMRGADSWAGTIKSGGKTRRAAKMVVLDVDHPDIREFIWCKAKEEKKANALRDAGFDMSIDGEGFTSIQYQNANNSVRLTDDFMRAVENDDDWHLIARATGQPIGDPIPARQLMREIADAAWQCADPGVQYDTTINQWHTCPVSGRINASNPCCFVGKTPINTMDGPIAIAELVRRADAGERLPSVASVTPCGKPLHVPITRAFSSGLTIELCHLDTEHGETFSCTPEHRFLTSDGEWVQARDLEGCSIRSVADRVAQAGGETAPEAVLTVAQTLVVGVTLEQVEPTEVYDLEIADLHNFAIGAGLDTPALVVHNSEYMHVDDSACNLASLNLMKFRRADGSFDVPAFEHAVDIMLLAQEILVGPCSYPTEQIAVNARAFRQLGLGYANLGAYLMSNGMAYDSDAGRGTAAAITALMTGRAYLESARVAAAIGPYERYEENRDAHNAVMRMHRDATRSIPDAACSDKPLLSAARAVWEETVAAGEVAGYRNAQSSVLAPTGTISFLMDCDTTGVEPDFSLVKFKELVGGGQMTIVNQTIPMALRTLGYSDEQIEQIEAYIDEHATIVGAPGLAGEHLSIFDVAVGERAISHMGHIKMMGAVQPFISGAISKCVAGDTLVASERGLVRIGALHNGERPDSFRDMELTIASLDGKRRTDAFYYGGTHPVREVRLRSGHKVVGTENHRLLTCGEDGLVWRRLDEIEPGEYVATQYGDDMWSATPASFADFVGLPAHGSQKRIVVPAEMTERLAFFLGAYVAEGHIARTNHTVRIANADERVISRLVADTEILFGFTPRVSRQPGKCPSVDLSSIRLVEFLDYLGAGQRASDKRIPDAVLRSPRTMVLAFLEGLCLDAYLTTSGMSKWAICVDSPKLLDDLQAVLTNLGVVHGRVSKHNAVYDKSFDEVYCCGRETQRLIAMISFVEQHKQVAADQIAARTFAQSPADVIPGVTGAELYELIPMGRSGRAGAGTSVRSRHRHLVDPRTKHVSRESVARIAQLPGVELPEWLDDVLERNLHFSPVAFATDVSAREVYDVSVPVTHAFVANGIVNHNTVNLPFEATIDDIADAYVRAWQCGVKALAIYRDGSKTAQALRTDAHQGKNVDAEAADAGYSQEQVDELIAEAVAAARTTAIAEVGPKRNRMPRERQSITHKFSIAGHEGYITAGMYEDGTLGEIFLTDIGKEGSTLRGLLNSFATSISIALQYGVPLEKLVEKFSYMRFEPEGITQNPEIPFAKSMPDYIMRWLASRFLDTDIQEELGIMTPEVRARKMAEDAGTSFSSSDTSGPANGGNGGSGGHGHGGNGGGGGGGGASHAKPANAGRVLPTVAGSHPATTRAAADALTDTPPVVPVRMRGLDLGPACSQCGGMMQRTGSCYTCSSCGNNTGCG
jgi:ribonucleotide reductase alpha subunit